MTDYDSDPRHIEFPPVCHSDTIALYEYWREKCGSRCMPVRSDIDPTTIPPQILRGISIVEVVPDERRYVYRLIGTGEAEVRGHDPTGKSVIEAYFGPSADNALACYDSVVATRSPLLDATPFMTPDGRYVTEETIFLPLSEDGANVQKILVFSCPRHRSPSAPLSRF
jgi:hypothetical protein